MNLYRNNSTNQLVMEQAGMRLVVTNNGYLKTTSVGGRYIRYFIVSQVLALGPKPMNFQVNDSIGVLVKPNEVTTDNIRQSTRFPYETTWSYIENLTRGGGFGGPGGIKTQPNIQGDVLGPGFPAGPFMTGDHSGPTGHTHLPVEHTYDPIP